MQRFSLTSSATFGCSGVLLLATSYRFASSSTTSSSSHKLTAVEARAAYRALGIKDMKSDYNAVRSKFRTLAMAHHPDVAASVNLSPSAKEAGNNTTSSGDGMAALNEAYAKLGKHFKAGGQVPAQMGLSSGSVHVGTSNYSGKKKGGPQQNVYSYTRGGGSAAFNSAMSQASRRHEEVEELERRRKAKLRDPGNGANEMDAAEMAKFAQGYDYHANPLGGMYGTSYDPGATGNLGYDPGLYGTDDTLYMQDLVGKFDATDFGSSAAQDSRRNAGNVADASKEVERVPATTAEDRNGAAETKSTDDRRSSKTTAKDNNDPNLEQWSTYFSLQSDDGFKNRRQDGPIIVEREGGAIEYHL